MYSKSSLGQLKRCQEQQIPWLILDVINNTIDRSACFTIQFSHRNREEEDEESKFILLRISATKVASKKNNKSRDCSGNNNNTNIIGKYVCNVCGSKSSMIVSAPQVIRSIITQNCNNNKNCIQRNAAATTTAEAAKY